MPVTEATTLQRWLDDSPFITFLGISCEHIDVKQQTVTLRMPMRPELERAGDGGWFPGGPVASLIDTAGDFAAILVTGAGVPTVNFRVDYLRPSIGTALRATATVRRLGRSVAVIDIHDEQGRLAAIGRAHHTRRHRSRPQQPAPPDQRRRPVKAHVLHSPGTVVDLRYEQSWPDPTPHEGSVVIAVKACALNYHDIFTIRGMPGIQIPMPIIIGIDMAGEVVAVGRGVTDWKPGDRVLVDPLDRKQNKLIGEMMDGGLAEYCEVGEHTLIPLPDDVSYADAAALPVAYGTAYRMMVTRGHVAADEKVLILGASGGVGTCCVQLARLAGSHVVVAASTHEKLARLKEIGAHDGINYTTEDVTAAIRERYGKPRVFGDGGVDIVVNFTGGDTWVPSLRCLHNNGRILTCGATAGYDPKTDLRFIWTFELNIIGSNGWQREDLHALLDHVRDGRLVPTIDSAFPLRRADEALTLLEQRGVVGKVIIEPEA